MKRGLKIGFQEREALNQEKSNPRAALGMGTASSTTSSIKSSFLGTTRWEFAPRRAEHPLLPQTPRFSRPGPAQLPHPAHTGSTGIAVGLAWGSLPALAGGSCSSRPFAGRGLLLPEPGTFPAHPAGAAGPEQREEGTPKISHNYRGTGLEPGRAEAAPGSAPPERAGRNISGKILHGLSPRIPGVAAKIPGGVRKRREP